jgi:polysaccharide biosynthesis/export protein
MRLNNGIRINLLMIGLLLPLAVMILSSGCVSPWYNAFLDPTQVGNFRDNVVKEIQDTVSFEDKPSGVPNAVDPTPDDLVATIEDYQLGPGDSFQISLLDFLARGTQSEFVVTVDDLGYIEVPQLNRVRVEGLSLSDVKAELARQAKAKGIYSEETEPTITLTMGDQQNRLFNISGAVQSPGSYRIPRADFRLREALNMGGANNEMAQAVAIGGRVQQIYIIRGAPRPRRIRERMETGESSVRKELVPESPPAESNMAVMHGPASQENVEVRPSTRPQQGRPALPNDEVERDLIDAVTPAGASSRPASQSRSTLAPSTGEASPPLRPFIFVNDKLIESPASQQSARTAPSAPATAGSAPQTQQSTRPVDWTELAGEGQQRIIRIPAEALRNGDNSCNIVVRHQDWIRVETGPVGTYYIGGHVVQAGQYPFAGEQVTLTQAVIAARGLDQLAWPTRCEIRRRIDSDREQLTQWDLARVMAGQDPDVFLRPGDVVNIGTHAIAPLLYTIRNAFRFSYGFSFSYDRNWAEYDTLSGQYYRSRTQASQKGLLSPFEF